MVYCLTLTPLFVILVRFNFLDFPSKSLKQKISTMPSDTKDRQQTFSKFQISFTFYAPPFDHIIYDEGKIFSTAKYPGSVWIFTLIALKIQSYHSDSGLRDTGQISPFLKNPQLDSHAHQSLRTTVQETGLSAEPFQHYGPGTLWQRNAPESRLGNHSFSKWPKTFV